MRSPRLGLLGVAAFAVCGFMMAGASAATTAATLEPTVAPAEVSVPGVRLNGSLKPVARVVVAGDVGTGEAPELKTGAAMDRAEGTNEYDAFLLLGDNVYPDGNPARLPQTVFGPFKQVLDGPTRLLAVLGNHDHDSGFGDAQAAALGMPARWYSTQIKGVTVIALDSNQVDNATQLAFLRNALKSSSRTTIVILHHPPYSGGEHGSSRDVRAAFAPLFEQYGVDLVLTGHDHDYQRSAPVNGVTYVVSGAAAKLRPTTLVAPMVIATSTYSFTDLSIYTDRIELNTFDQSLNLIDGATIPTN